MVDFLPLLSSLQKASELNEALHHFPRLEDLTLHSIALQNASPSTLGRPPPKITTLRTNFEGDRAVATWLIQPQNSPLYLTSFSAQVESAEELIAASRIVLAAGDSLNSLSMYIVHIALTAEAVQALDFQKTTQLQSLSLDLTFNNMFRDTEESAGPALINVQPWLAQLQDSRMETITINIHYPIMRPSPYDILDIARGINWQLIDDAFQPPAFPALTQIRFSLPALHADIHRLLPICHSRNIGLVADEYAED
ncbi:hypothetical protein HGRIS_005891 [Hohenbuehelia grisea]|uniref:Uncharacterized protein n=1 Tax=Hohenbuehelia grisea TaxID=104357 RepID=A0ABR3JZ34_9AGAR